MISLPEYKVMGEDGHEYGPVSAEQICKWISEQRLERKSPVKPSDSPDWVFLESRPEFAAAFQPPPPRPERPKRGMLMVVIIILAGGFILVALKIFNHL